MVVLSADVFNERSSTVIAMALTSQPQRAGFSLVLELESVNFGKPAWVKIGQIRTLSTRRIGKKMGRVSPEEVQLLIEGLNEILTGYAFRFSGEHSRPLQSGVRFIRCQDWRCSPIPLRTPR